MRLFSRAVIALAVTLLAFNACEARKSVPELLAEADNLMANAEGPAGYDSKMLTKAEKCYSLVLEREPSNLRAIYARGKARFRNHELGLALEDFNQAVAYDSKNPEAYYLRALCRIAATPKDKAAASADLQKTLALSPNYKLAARILRLLSAS